MLDPGRMGRARVPGGRAVVLIAVSMILTIPTAATAAPADAIQRRSVRAAGTPAQHPATGRTICMLVSTSRPSERIECPKSHKGWSHVTYGGVNAGADATAQAAAAWSCTIYVGDVTHPTTNNMQAETSQTCSGAFGSQWISAQFLRSSWSGWRAYSGWGGSKVYYGPYVDLWWNIGCNYSGDWYDYVLAAIGCADGGCSITTLSGTNRRYRCGSSAP